MNLTQLPVVCVVLSLSLGTPLHAGEPGFVSLFDGKTLKGWTINCLPKDRQLAAKAWTVDKGTILANSMGGCCQGESACQATAKMTSIAAEEERPDPMGICELRTACRPEIGRWFCWRTQATPAG